jgi:hypothetical protein
MLSGHQELKDALLSAGYADRIMQIIACTLRDTSTHTQPRKVASIDYPKGILPNFDQKKQIGRMPSVCMLRQLDVHSSVLSEDATARAMFTNAAALVEETTKHAVAHIAIEILFNLCDVEGLHIRQALQANPCASTALLLAWTCKNPLSNTAKNILLRAGVESTTQVDITTMPWAYLIDTKQIFVLASFLTLEASTEGLQYQATANQKDKSKNALVYTDSRYQTLVSGCPLNDVMLHNVKEGACEAIWKILRDTNARGSVGTSIGNSVDLLHTPPSSPILALAAGTSSAVIPVPASLIHSAVIELCFSHLLHTLESLAPKIPAAAGLLAYLFAWEDINFTHVSHTFTQSLTELLESADVTIRMSAITLLHSAITHSSQSRSRISSQLSRHIAISSLEKYIAESIVAMASASQQNMVENGSTSAAASADDVLKMALISFAYFFTPEFIRISYNKDRVPKGHLPWENMTANDVDDYTRQLYSPDALNSLAVGISGILVVLEKCTPPMSERDEDGGSDMFTKAFVCDAISSFERGIWENLVALSQVSICSTTVLKTHCVRTLSQYVVNYTRRDDVSELDDDERFVLQSCLQILENLCTSNDILAADKLCEVCECENSEDWHVLNALVKLISQYSTDADGDEVLSGDYASYAAALRVVNICACTSIPWTDMLASSSALLEMLKHNHEHGTILLIQHLACYARTEPARGTGADSLGIYESKMTLTANLCRCAVGRFRVFHSLKACEYSAKLVIESGSAVPPSLLLIILKVYQALVPEMFSQVKQIAIEISDKEPVLEDSEIVANVNHVVRACVEICAGIESLSVVDSALSVLVSLTSHPAAAQSMHSVDTYTKVLACLQRVSPPQQTPTHLQMNETLAVPSDEVVTAETILRSQACFKTLRLVHGFVSVDAESFLSNRGADSAAEAPSSKIVDCLMDILGTAPRTLHWFPSLLHASEVLQVLVMDRVHAQSFISAINHRTTPPPTGSLESHILLDVLKSINNTLQPTRIAATKLPDFEHAHSQMPIKSSKSTSTNVQSSALSASATQRPQSSQSETLPPPMTPPPYEEVRNGTQVPFSNGHLSANFHL